MAEKTLGKIWIGVDKGQRDSDWDTNCWSDAVHLGIELEINK